MRFIISRHVLTRRLKLPFGRSSRSYFSRGICEENTARYCVGGYHPVKLGDIFNKGKYEIISKLGYGVYSTVWLAFDRQYAAMGKKLFLVANASSRVKQHVALKILTADSFGQEKDTFEIDILKHIRNEAVCDPRGSMFSSCSTVSNMMAQMERTPASSFLQWGRTCPSIGDFSQAFAFLHPS